MVERTECFLHRVNEDALSKIKEMGYQAVPVIVTETENWYGFQPDKLATLLN